MTGSSFYKLIVLFTIHRPAISRQNRKGRKTVINRSEGRLLLKISGLKAPGFHQELTGVVDDLANIQWHSLYGFFI
jgi:hypothetical protein